MIKAVFKISVLSCITVFADACVDTVASKQHQSIRVNRKLKAIGEEIGLPTTIKHLKKNKK